VGKDREKEKRDSKLTGYKSRKKEWMEVGNNVEIRVERNK
jgi:hypothetical protein